MVLNVITALVLFLRRTSALTCEYSPYTSVTYSNMNSKYYISDNFYRRIIEIVNAIIILYYNICIRDTEKNEQTKAYT